MVVWHGRGWGASIHEDVLNLGGGGGGQGSTEVKQKQSGVLLRVCVRART